MTKSKNGMVTIVIIHLATNTLPVVLIQSAFPSHFQRIQGSLAHPWDCYRIQCPITLRM